MGLFGNLISGILLKGRMKSKFKSLQGKLLLDGGNLYGSFFTRTVVLICQHSPEGAFGLVLNRDSNKQVGELVIEELPELIREQNLFLGGPVQPAVMSFLHTDAFMPDANVIPNLSVGNSLEKLADLSNSFAVDRKFRVFAGYSGWGAGQLESEMKRKSWITHPASVELIFNAAPELLWKSILLKKGGLFQLLANAPEDLSCN